MHCPVSKELKDPPILILDKATSAVDNETETAIHKSLCPNRAALDFLGVRPAAYAESSFSCQNVAKVF